MMCAQRDRIRGFNDGPYYGASTAKRSQYEHIPAHKKRSFRVLFDKLTERYGCAKGAAKACGLAYSTCYRFTSEGKLTVYTAKKIYNTYIKEFGGAEDERF